MSLSDEISRRADRYDPERDADGRASAKLIQGALFATVSAEISKFVRIVDVDQPMDSATDLYEDYFIVETGSGHRIKVTVEVVEEFED